MKVYSAVMMNLITLFTCSWLCMPQVQAMEKSTPAQNAYAEVVSGGIFKGCVQAHQVTIARIARVNPAEIARYPITETDIWKQRVIPEIIRVRLRNIARNWNAQEFDAIKQAIAEKGLVFLECLRLKGGRGNVSAIMSAGRSLNLDMLKAMRPYLQETDMNDALVQAADKPDPGKENRQYPVMVYLLSADKIKEYASANKKTALKISPTENQKKRIQSCWNIASNLAATYQLYEKYKQNQTTTAMAAVTTAINKLLTVIQEVKQENLIATPDEQVSAWQQWLQQPPAPRPAPTPAPTPLPAPAIIQRPELPPAPQPPTVELFDKYRSVPNIDKRIQELTDPSELLGTLITLFSTNADFVSYTEPERLEISKILAAKLSTVPAFGKVFLDQYDETLKAMISSEQGQQILLYSKIALGILALTSETSTKSIDTLIQDIAGYSQVTQYPIFAVNLIKRLKVVRSLDLITLVKEGFAAYLRKPENTDSAVGTIAEELNSVRNWGIEEEKEVEEQEEETEEERATAIDFAAQSWDVEALENIKPPLISSEKNRALANAATRQAQNPTDVQQQEAFFDHIIGQGANLDFVIKMAQWPAKTTLQQYQTKTKQQPQPAQQMPPPAALQPPPPSREELQKIAQDLAIQELITAAKEDSSSKFSARLAAAYGLSFTASTQDIKTKIATPLSDNLSAIDIAAAYGSIKILKYLFEEATAYALKSNQRVCNSALYNAVTSDKASQDRREPAIAYLLTLSDNMKHAQRISEGLKEHRSDLVKWFEAIVQKMAQAPSPQPQVPAATTATPSHSVAQTTPQQTPVAQPPQTQTPTTGTAAQPKYAGFFALANLLPPPPSQEPQTSEAPAGAQEEKEAELPFIRGTVCPECGYVDAPAGVLPLMATCPTDKNSMRNMNDLSKDILDFFTRSNINKIYLILFYNQIKLAHQELGYFDKKLFIENNAAFIKQVIISLTQKTATEVGSLLFALYKLTRPQSPSEAVEIADRYIDAFLLYESHKDVCRKITIEEVFAAINKVPMRAKQQEMLVDFAQRMFVLTPKPFEDDTALQTAFAFYQKQNSPK